MEFQRQHSENHQRLIFIQDHTEFTPQANLRPISFYSKDYAKTFERRYRANLELASTGSDLPWDNILEDLSELKVSFLKSITLHKTIPELIDNISHSEYTYIVSDGSAKGDLMTYGWVLYSHTKQKLATSNGPCTGRPSLMRSEAAGMLSPILLLSTLQRISNYAMGRPTVKFMADNQSLITREMQHQEYKDPYPN